jgi:hypothetical protein
LLASGAVVLLAFLLGVRADGQVSPRGLPGLPLPQVCVARAWTDVKCPACGLTRSIIHLGHGDLASSRRAHRLGWLIGGVIVLQLPYRWIALRQGPRVGLSVDIEALCGCVLVLLLIGNWLVELAAQV